MRLSTITSIFALCASTQAFPDTSPFILSSTAALDIPVNVDQLQSNTHVLQTAKDLLASCPTDKYIVISQPSLHSRDLVSSSASPMLFDLVYGSVIQSTYSVAGMYGEIASEYLLSYIRKACGAKYEEGKIYISLLPLQGLPEVSKEVDERGRMVALKENDDIIADVVVTKPLGDSYTILYLSDVRDIKYEAHFGNIIAADFKRDGKVIHRANATDPRSFFEKYQLFNSGLYMVIIASVVMLSILYVGIQALSSLEVSVGAFEPDMGPSAQKKHQ